MVRFLTAISFMISLYFYVSIVTSQSLVMEAVQVLTAIVKFHFHIVQLVEMDAL